MTEAGDRAQRAPSFASNAAWLVIGDAIAKVAAFAFIVVVARGLGREEFGHFNFAVSFVPLFLVLGVWGLDDAMFREIARDRSRFSQLFASGSVMRIVLGVAGYLAAIAIAPVFVSGEGWIAVALVGLGLMLDELGSFVGTAFKAFEMMRFRALRILINRIVTMVLGIGALLAGGDLVVVCVMYALGSFAGFVYAWSAMRRHLPPVRAADRDRVVMRDLFLRGVPLAAAAIMSTIAFRIDTVMLQGYEGAVAVGLYGVAYRFLDSFLFVAWGMANVSLPRIARSDGGADARRAFSVAMAASLAFYVPLAIGGVFAAGWAVELLFGPRYVAAAPAVRWLLGAGVAYAVGYQARMGCLGLGRRKPIAWVAAVALVVNVGANIVVIPRYSFTGAAVVTLVTGALEAVLLVAIFLRASRGRVEPLLLAPLLAGGVMWAVLQVGSVDDGAAVAVGSLVYAVSLAGSTRALAPAEFRSLTDLVRRRLRRAA